VRLKEEYVTYLDDLNWSFNSDKVRLKEIPLI